MTSEELESIKARVEAARAGPWTYDERDGTIMTPNNYVFPYDENDKIFAAHARQDIPILIAEVERLRELVKKAEFPDECCPWCGEKWRLGGHANDCSAFSDTGVLR